MHSREYISGSDTMTPRTAQIGLNKPRITASCDQHNRLSIFRVDVGQSRAMCTIEKTWLCWPQALRIIPNTNQHSTLVTDRPMPKRKNK
jgi:hypothetical protein